MCQDRRSRWAMVLLRTDRNTMNRIVYIVGLVVIVLFILGFFGLR
jgi:hypothetical protein